MSSEYRSKKRNTAYAIRPRKHRVCSFRSRSEQVIPPDRCWYAGLLSCWSKHSTSLAFREFAPLIVEIFYDGPRWSFKIEVEDNLTCCRYVMKCCPLSSVSEKHGREVDSMEVDVILAHELV